MLRRIGASSASSVGAIFAKQCKMIEHVGTVGHIFTRDVTGIAVEFNVATHSSSTLAGLIRNIVQSNIAAESRRRQLRSSLQSTQLLSSAHGPSSGSAKKDITEINTENKKAEVVLRHSVLVCGHIVRNP